MRSLKLNAMVFVIILITNTMHCQEKNDVEVLKNIYKVLQIPSTSSKDIVSLTPEINWNEKFSSEKEIDRYVIGFGGIMKNKWHSLEFTDLLFHRDGNNKVMVSGTVSGKQPTECEFRSNRFKHSWTIQNGKLIDFSEHQ